MRDPGIELQTAYYQRLQGITYDGKSVPVYDVVPAKPVYPHIKFQDRTITDISDKNSYRMDLIFGLRVIDRFPANQGSRMSIYAISSEIKERIRQIYTGIELETFNVITSTLASETFLTELTETYYYLRNEMRFRHHIQDIPEKTLTYQGDTITYNGDTLTYIQWQTSN